MTRHRLLSTAILWGGAAMLAAAFAAGARTEGSGRLQSRPPSRPGLVERVRLPHGPASPLLEITYAERDREVARRLARIAAEFDPRLFSGREGDGPGETRAARPQAAAAPDTVRLLLAADEAAFRRASGGRFPDWGLAVAFPGEAAIVMRPPRLVGGDVQDPGQVLAHELVHVYLALFLGPAEPAAPRWFHEGLASLLAGEWGWSERFELGLTLLARRVIPLEELEAGFPPRQQPAFLAYLESLTAAAYLRDISGEEGLRVLLRNLRRLEDFDAALRRTYGITYGEFQERWQTSLARRYGWAAAAASSWTYWTPAALALILLVIVRRARYRARLAELEREERLRPEEGPAEWRGAEAGWRGQGAGGEDVAREGRGPVGERMGEEDDTAGEGRERAP